MKITDSENRIATQLKMTLLLVNNRLYHRKQTMLLLDCNLSRDKVEEMAHNDDNIPIKILMKKLNFCEVH